MTDQGSTPARKAPAKKTTSKKTTAKKTATKAPAKKTAKKQAAATKPAAKKAAAATTAPPKRSRLEAARERARSAPTSRYFTNARTRARRMIDDPEALERVAQESSSRTSADTSGHFSGVLDDFRTLVRLVVAYARGQYREIPPDSLVLVVAGLLYVVSPLDLIPDAVPVIGMADDAVVVGWVIRAVREELEAFRAWEATHTQA
ncbi:MAG: YkvA family protein [Nocardioides sp.]